MLTGAGYQLRMSDVIRAAYVRFHIYKGQHAPRSPALPR